MAPDPLLRHAIFGARTLAEADPIQAARTLARGLQIQTPGGRLTVLRAFVQTLLEQDPALAPTIAADLAAFTSGQP